MFERKKQAGKIYFLPIDQINRRRFRHGGSSASRSWLRWPRASVKMVCCSPSRCEKCRMAATNW